GCRRAEAGRSAARPSAACWIGGGCRVRTWPCSASLRAPVRREAPRSRPGAKESSDLHLRRRLDNLAVLAEVEERSRLETEHAGEQRGRELLDAGVVFAHRVVEEASGRRDLVLDVAQLGL